MLKCPSCGFNNPEKRERCLRCSTLLRSTEIKEKAKPRRFPEFSVAAKLRNMIYRVKAKLKGRLPRDVPHRYPWTAAYLALIPGLGQLYNRQKFKAAFFLLLHLAFYGFFILTITDNLNILASFLLLGWLCYAMADAFIIAYAINGHSWRWYHVGAFFCALIFYVGAGAIALQFFGQGVFVLPRSSARIGSHIQPGDRYFAAKWPLWGGNFPRRGAFVYYNPGHWSVLVSDNWYSINERNSFGVVTGRPGDLLEWDEGEPIQVNGEPAPPAWLPPRPNGVPTRLEIELPGDAAGILISHVTREEWPFELPLGGQGISPRVAASFGIWFEGYDAACTIPNEEIYGVILCRWWPPERRRWFGLDNGLWRDYPEGYPAGEGEITEVRVPVE